jgi:hypothetical protein
MAMEKKKADQLLLDLLAEAAASGFVTSSQMAKGFGRVSDAVEDLSLDVPDAREKLAALAGLATADGWLSESAGKQLDQELHSPVVNSDATRKFKAKAVALIQVGPGGFACVNAIMRMLPSSACKVGVFVEGWCSVRNEHSCLRNCGAKTLPGQCQLLAKRGYLDQRVQPFLLRQRSVGV